MYILTTVYDGVIESIQVPSFTKGAEQALISAENIHGKGKLFDLRKRLVNINFSHKIITIEESEDNVFMTLYRLQDREIMDIYSEDEGNSFHIQVVRID